MPRPITHMFSVSKTTGPVYYVVLEHENNNGKFRINVKRLQ